ncbi:aminobutyraldehyde dehydrogenase [Dietzia lutea]|uniref:Gamma-aminobutyraldehyde dehydrogenase n=1 Tax=Dietzia lutea TaxID=546160 RepID=A0A2S1RCX6_9ACTN|nr:aminobutyraldehyde dehydrogenase [Dietzia lutea]AWH94124.1 gamma-aminobutyraldehyde dehydrogenase [Dietzia lutea]
MNTATPATGVLPPTKNYIGGEWLDAADGKEMDVFNPATGQAFASVPESSAEDVSRAVEAAGRALPEWLRTTPRERAELLFKIADRIEERGEDIARVDTAENGKPIFAARAEPADVADMLRFFAGAARTMTGLNATEYLRGSTSLIRREPIGIAGQIAPWNYPLPMAMWKVGPALAAGNAVVFKPSEHTPLTALLLAELCHDILPPGVLNIVLGHGDPVGEALVTHPDIGIVSVTGSANTGRRIAHNAADTVKRLHLELGGKTPVLVFDDVDVQRVVSDLKAVSFYNAGQDCTAASRVLVSEKIYDRFMEELVPAVESIVVDDPMSARTEMGPVITEGQRERILGLVDRAVSAGAEVVTGGSSVAGQSGYFVEPTIVAAPDQRSEIIQNEIFGPALTVQRFSDENQAIEWANDVDYGLHATVFTEDLRRAMRLSKALDFGAVCFNDHAGSGVEMPHGGFKQSGYGKDCSVYAVEEYTRIKHVMYHFGDGPSSTDLHTHPSST